LQHEVDDEHLGVEVVRVFEEYNRVYGAASSSAKASGSAKTEPHGS
jgi:hypothetical protein